MEKAKTHRHTISALVENRPGVLARVAGLFSRRGFNIDSLAVSRTHDPQLSRMTIVVEGDDMIMEQVTKQLHKLIDVVKVSDITDQETVSRELALLKIKADPQKRSEIIQIVDIFRGQIVDFSEDSMIIQVVGQEDKLDALEKLIKRLGIIELVRTGMVELLRGKQST